MGLPTAVRFVIDIFLNKRTTNDRHFTRSTVTAHFTLDMSRTTRLRGLRSLQRPEAATPSIIQLDDIPGDPPSTRTRGQKRQNKTPQGDDEDFSDFLIDPENPDQILAAIDNITNPPEKPKPRTRRSTRESTTTPTDTPTTRKRRRAKKSDLDDFIESEEEITPRPRKRARKSKDISEYFSPERNTEQSQTKKKTSESTPKKRGRKPKSDKPTPKKSTYVKKPKSYSLQARFESNMQALDANTAYKERHSKQYDLALRCFLQQHAGTWTPLEAQDAESYFPHTPTSPPFFVGTDEQQRMMPQFGVMTSDDIPDASPHVIANTGGTVQSINWLPTRTEFEELPAPRFLALGVHQEINPLHMNGQKSSAKNMIQIWQVDGLQTPWVDRGHCDPSAKLALGICHDYGCVLHLEWCPRTSTWEDSSLWSQTGDVSFLGVLAACFTDGSLRLFCVPHPSSVTDNYNANSPPAFLSIKPFATLNIGDSSIYRSRWNVTFLSTNLIYGSSTGKKTIHLWMNDS